MGYPGPVPWGTFPASSPYWYPPPPPPQPTAAFGLSLVGGLLILYGAIAGFAFFGFFLPFAAAPGATFLALSLLGFGSGLAIIVLAILLLSYPEHHSGLGVGILVLSIASLVDFGGGFVGLVLGVIGGILAIAFSPAPSLQAGGGWTFAYYPPTPSGAWGYPAAGPPAAPPTTPPTVPPTGPGPGSAPPPGSPAYSAVDRGRPCPNCGRLLAYGSRFCSSCGAAAQPT
ncbi:MAG TPA: zinc ribbon domain-containing protein [Thermoplasmata archaeon]|nr:zinc ribbon domain-containing protein [Thermoplasmata archaeon]